MLSLTFSFFLVELVVGHVTNSLALVGDSYHMLSDVVALCVGLASVKISKLHSQKNTYGWARAEVLGALVNSVFLIALCFTIFVEAIEKLSDSDNIVDIDKIDLMLYVGIGGLGLNLIGLLLFHHHSHGHSHGGGEGHSHGGGGSGTKKGHSHNHSTTANHKHSHGASSENHVGSGADGEEVDEQQVVLQQNGGGSIQEATRVGEESSESSCDSDCDEFVTHAHAGGLPLGINEGTGGTTSAADDKKAKKNASSAQLNMRAVFLHVLGDALGSVGVIASALIIKYTSGDWRFKVDPIMSMIMVVIIFSSSIRLLKESAFILLQTVPTHIQVSALKAKLLTNVKGVLAVHEFHVWQLAGNRIIASAHIRCQTPHEYMRIAEEVKCFFHNEGIHSTTVQPEFVEFEEISTDRDCVLECGPDKTCFVDTCCARRKIQPGNETGELRQRTVAVQAPASQSVQGTDHPGGRSCEIEIIPNNDSSSSLTQSNVDTQSVHYQERVNQSSIL